MTTRVERGKVASIDAAFYLDGALTNATAGVTVTVTRADGSVLATDAPTTNPATGVYRYALPAQSTLGILTLAYSGTWSGAVQTETQQVEIVGNFYLTTAALRALPNLGDTAKFTEAELREARTWFERRWEDYVGVAFVPRYARDRLDGTGYASLRLPHWPVRVSPLTGLPVVYSVRAYTTGAAYTAFTAAELADLVLDAGSLSRLTGTWSYGRSNVVVEYEHCVSDAAPADVADAAAVAIRQKLLRDHSGDRGNRHFGVVQEGVFNRNIKGPFFNDELNDLADDYRARYNVPAVA